MVKDVLITPSSGKVEFKDTNATVASIYEQSGDLFLNSVNGSVLINGAVTLGDGLASNLEIGGDGISVTMNFMGGGILTTSGNALNLGLPGDIVNLNTSGVTYNFPSNILTTSDYTDSIILTKIKNVDGSGSGLDSDLLDGQDGSYYLNWTNITNKPSPTITLSGDLTGSVTLTDLASGTLTATVADDSHNHVISNVDGLQTALDGKASTSVATTGANGLMSSTDKSKLDDIAANANNYSLPTATSTVLGGVKTGTNITNSSGTISVADASTTVKGVVQLTSATDSTSTTLAATASAVKAAYDLASTKLSPDGKAAEATTAEKLAAARTITLSGDVTGVTSFDGSTNVTITTTVEDDSHNHTIANVDGLQTALDGKLALTGGTLTGFLTAHTDPTSNLHVATKQYVDSVVSGLDVKKSVKAATTANITLSGTQTIDGVALAVNDRVLVKNQTTTSQNGIYVVQSGSWTRSGAADSNNEMNPGAFTFVEQGTTNGDTGWILSTDGTITVGTTSLTFTQFSSAGVIGVDSTLTKSGNTIGLKSGVATAGTYKSLTIDTYGRVTAGTNPTTLAGYGITDAVSTTGNAASASKWQTARTITLGGDLTGSVSLDGTTNVTLSATVADDSHNHVISNVDGLQTALDGKLNLTGGTMTGVLTVDNYVKISAPTGIHVGNDASIITSQGVEHTELRVVDGAGNRGILVRGSGDSGGTWTNIFEAKESSLKYKTFDIWHADNFNPSSKLDAGANAVSASKWATARTITLGGDASGSVSIDGSANVTLSVTVADDSHNHVISNVDGLQAALDGKLNLTGGTITGALTIEGAGEILNLSSGNADMQVGIGDVDAGFTLKYTGSQTGNNNALELWSDNYGGVGELQVFRATQDGVFAITQDNATIAGYKIHHAGNFNPSSKLDAGANAVSASKLATARTISLTGDVTGSVSFDGSGNVSITTTVADDSHNHVISNVDGLQTALDGKASTSVATTGANGLMSSTDKSKLDGIAANANNYTHPTGDGNLHVPVTGTGNNGKVLKAGSTAGSLSWGTLGFNDMSDVTLSGLSSQHVLNYNGSAWVNSATPNAKAFLNEGLRTSKATAANQWTKITSISLTAQGQVATTRIGLMGGEDSGATGTAPVANIFFRVAQSGAMASAPIVSLRLMENQNITINELKAITTTNTAASTIVELYVNLKDINEIFTFVPSIVNGYSRITFHEAQSLVTTLPTGTQIAAVYDTIDEGQLTAASTSVKGIVQLSSATNSTSTTLAATASAVKAAYDLANGKASTSVATTGANGLMSSTDKSKLDGIATNANNYSHPAYTTRTVSLDASGAEVIDTISITSDATGHVTAAAATKRTLTLADLGYTGATNANNYSHPTGDGNLHVPATGTTNNGKVLKAGSTAGSLSWGTLSASDVGALASGSNAVSASKWATARTITLGGDLTGSVSLDGSANVTLTATVSDDSHSHTIANVDGLQTALDAKLDLAGGTVTGDVQFGSQKGITWGTTGTSAYIRESTAGQLKIGSDQNVDFYETDSNVLAIQIDTNNRTLDAKGGLLENGVALSSKYLSSSSTSEQTISGSEVHVQSTSSTAKFTIEFNETEGSLDFVYSTT